MHYALKDLPTLMIYKEGQMIWRQSGELDANTIIRIGSRTNINQFFHTFYNKQIIFSLKCLRFLVKRISSFAKLLRCREIRLCFQILHFLIHFPNTFLEILWIKIST